MTGFDPNKIDQEPSIAADTTVGAILRRARNDAGLSRDDIAARLNLRLSQIIALEEDRADLLPPLAYATGFVRSYARRLDLDEAQLAAAFKAQMDGQLRSGSTAEEFVIAAKNASGSSINWRPLMAGLTALLIAGGAGAGWALLSGYSDSQPIGARVTVAPPEAGVIPSAVTARQIDTRTLNAAPPAEVVLETGADVDSDPAELTSPAEEAAPAEPVAAQQSAFVYKITALDMSWVKILDADGVELANQIMRPGQTLQLERDDKMTLTTGNLAGLAIEINGKPLPAAFRNKATGALESAMRSITLDATALLTAQ